MIKEKLEKLCLPELLNFSSGGKVTTAEQWRARREEILSLLSSEIYGEMPDKPQCVLGEIVSSDKNAFAGKAVQYEYNIRFDTPCGKFSFPLTLAVPKSAEKSPLILHIAFRPFFPDKYVPAEEIIDSGFAVAVFCYEHITADRDDSFSSGLASMYGERTEKSWGKIGMWAFAASRALDFLLTLNEIDGKNVAVLGHSRLGKTALWAGASDERFSFIFSNDSGCGGAALSRDKTGETVEKICRVFPYWFCKKYQKYSGREHDMPFDQHFLLALSAPRKVCVGSAELDLWADPFSEFLSCAAAGDAYRLLGCQALISPDILPKAGDNFDRGYIGYHLRSGTHYLSRTDWRIYMDYMLLHKYN